MVPKNYITIRPPVYWLVIGFWQWCKLSEICAIVPELAVLTDTDFSPSPYELVERFASLIRPNRTPTEESNGPRQKIFRYSVDGSSLRGTEVPAQESMPKHFQLDIETPYPEGLFVPEGWAIDVLQAISKGAVRAVDLNGLRVGFPPEGISLPSIILEGTVEMALAGS